MVPGISNITLNEDASNSNSAEQIGLWNNRTSPMSATVKEEKVGSLSFSVINTTQKLSINEPNQAANSLKGSAAQKPVAKKPAARTKVPFEKGYSQMDWLKLTRTHPDLAGPLVVLLLFQCSLVKSLICAVLFYLYFHFFIFVVMNVLSGVRLQTYPPSSLIYL